VSEYVSAHTLLADARLRLDALGQEMAALVVEGPDDKRLLVRQVQTASQIIVSGGRTLLLAAHRTADADDLRRIAFLTDCDFEVGFGNLQPARSLVITMNADVEADLLDLGIFHSIALELVPDALQSDKAAESIGKILRARSVEFAATLGQIRQLAKVHGVEINLDDIKYKKVRVPGTVTLDKALLIRKVGQQLRHCGLTVPAFETAVTAMPSGYKYCNGHDIINALQFVLREDFRVAVDRAELARHVRLAASSILDRWPVLVRLRKWQDETRKTLLI
jgi:hypothetical protein